MGDDWPVISNLILYSKWHFNISHVRTIKKMDYVEKYFSVTVK